MALPSESGKNEAGGDYAQISLAYLPPTLRQTRITLIGTAVLLMGLLVALPFAAHPVPKTAGFLPALDATIFVTDLITACIFLAHFRTTRSRALCALGCGYFFAAIIVVVHGLTFPGVVSETGNIFGGLHTNFRIYQLWHFGLPVSALAYVLLRDEKRAKASSHGLFEIIAICGFSFALALLSCILFLAFLPAVDPVEGRWLTGITMAVCAGALCALWIARRSALDQWLMIVMFAMTAELAVTGLVGGLGLREYTTLGFYTGRILSLITSTLVLAALLGESTRLYAGVARGSMLERLVNSSQLLSAEIDLTKLVDRILRVAAEYTGADHGLLILPTGDGYSIHVLTQTGNGVVEVTMRQGPITELSFPRAIVDHVINSKERVVLENPLQQTRASQPTEDPYIRLRKPRSILCLPLVRHGALGGVLYLENIGRLSAFATERSQLLELLGSQAAISLENAVLYASLREREARVRRLIDANIIGIFTWNLDGRIIDANGAFLGIVGYGGRDLASGRMRWKDLMPDTWDPTHDPIMEELTATGATQPFRATYIRKDGSSVPVLIGAALFDGTPVEGVAFVVDMTDQDRAEAMARERERQYNEIQLELAHANRVAMIGHLSASIAHELNQPLQGMMANGQTVARLLARQEPPLDEAKDAVSRLLRDGTRANDVISRIRTLIKKAPPQNGMFGINEAILEIVGLLHVEATKARASIQTKLDPELPEIQGDRVQLQQVVLNLTVNALDAVRATTIGPREILIGTETLDADNIRVSVRDSGRGIDGGDTDKIFEPFYTTKPQGLGMGLSICRSIVAAHGGKLWAEPGSPRGAVFYFTLRSRSGVIDAAHR